jgi:hypothetical protein
MNTWEPVLIRLARKALRSPALLPAPPPATRVELAAAWPIARGGDFGGTRLDGSVDRLAERFLPAPYAAAVSNTFRHKQRPAFTVAVLVFSGVMFMVMMRLVTSVNATIATDSE